MITSTRCTDKCSLRKADRQLFEVIQSCWHAARRCFNKAQCKRQTFANPSQCDVDPPAHFIKGLRIVDQIDPKEMILPLVLIGVHAEAASNPDYTLSLERMKKWKKDHGQIPSGAFVAMRTDWSKRWPDAAKWRTGTPTALRTILDGAYPR